MGLTKSFIDKKNVGRKNRESTFLDIFLKIQKWSRSTSWNKKNRIKKRRDFEGTYSSNLISIDQNKLVPVVWTRHESSFGIHESPQESDPDTTPNARNQEDPPHDINLPTPLMRKKQTFFFFSPPLPFSSLSHKITQPHITQWTNSHPR